jgi:4-hydroxybenzoate polyprenyltransferase
VLLAAGSALLWPLGAAALISGLLLIGLIIVYDLWHKRNPLSPLLMACCRLMVYITAFLAFAPRLTPTLLGAGALLTLYVVGLTYIAKQENRSSLVAYWPAAALFLPALAFAAQLPELWALPLLLLFIGWVAYSISFVYRRQGRSIGRAIGQLIAGISLVDALVLALAGSGVGVALALAAFGLTLFFQRYIKGT